MLFEGALLGTIMSKPKHFVFKKSFYTAIPALCLLIELNSKGNRSVLSCLLSQLASLFAALGNSIC